MKALVNAKIPLNALIARRISRSPADKVWTAKDCLDLELQRSRDFEASIEDEERHRRTPFTAPEAKLRNLLLTRERNEE